MYASTSSLFFVLVIRSCIGGGVQFEIENITVTPATCTIDYHTYINTEVFGADTQRSYQVHYQAWSTTKACGKCSQCSMPISDWNDLNFVSYATYALCHGADGQAVKCTNWINGGKNDSYSPFANYSNTNTMTVFGDDDSFWLINTLVVQHDADAPYYTFVIANCSSADNESSIPFNESFYNTNDSYIGVSITGHYKCLQTSQPPDANDESNVGLKVGLVVLAVMACMMTVSTGYLFYVFTINKRKVVALGKLIPQQPGTSDATGDYEFRTWS